MRSSANYKLSSKVGEGKQKRAEFGGFSGLLTKLLEPLCVSPEPRPSPMFTISVFELMLPKRKLGMRLAIDDVGVTCFFRLLECTVQLGLSTA